MKHRNERFMRLYTYRPEVVITKMADEFDVVEASTAAKHAKYAGSHVDNPLTSRAVLRSIQNLS